jgi:uncharacterized protein DUF3224
MPTAEGNFEVRLSPQGGHDAVPPELGRLGIDKDFRGDLTGTSRGEMLAVNDAATGSAVYVALEKVDARLAGRSGSFWLAHRGTIHGEDSSLDVTVVPGSATDELVGLSGSMTIDPAADHAYTFEYDLPG